MARLIDLRPVGSTAKVIASAVVANAAATVTVPAVAGKRFYVEGYDIQGLGATAAGSITATLTGIGVGVTKNEIAAIPAGVTVAMSPVVRSYDFPLEGELGVAVVLTVPAFGAGNTKAAASIWGHYR